MLPKKQNLSRSNGKRSEFVLERHGFVSRPNRSPYGWWTTRWWRWSGCSGTRPEVTSSSARIRTTPGAWFRFRWSRRSFIASTTSSSNSVSSDSGKSRVTSPTWEASPNRLRHTWTTFNHCKKKSNIFSRQCLKNVPGEEFYSIINRLFKPVRPNFVFDIGCSVPHNHDAIMLY